METTVITEHEFDEIIRAGQQVPQIMVHPTKAEGGWPLVRLDCFTCEGWGSQGKISGWLGPGSANEHHVDDYLKEFFLILAPLLEYSDPKVLLNVVLTTRNGSSTRDRLDAARRVAAIGPHLAVIKEALAPKFGFRQDSYHFTNLWITEFINGVEQDIYLTLAVDAEEGILYIGDGDGYHRGFDETRPISLAEQELQHLPEIIEQRRKEGEV
jgi:hypothetical protein